MMVKGTNGSRIEHNNRSTTFKHQGGHDGPWLMLDPEAETEAVNGVEDFMKIKLQNTREAKQEQRAKRTQ